MEEYETYPYKRVYPPATAYNYPLSVIEDIYAHMNQDIPNNYLDDIEIMVRMLIVNLNYRYEYEYDTIENFKKHIEMFIEEEQGNSTYNGIIARAMKDF